MKNAAKKVRMNFPRFFTFFPSKFSSTATAEDRKIRMCAAAAAAKFLLGFRSISAILRGGGDQQNHKHGRHENKQQRREKEDAH